MNTDNVERLRGTVLVFPSETEREAVQRIDAALARMERGTYGVCVVCEGPIELERLEAVPETDRCGGCTAPP